MDDEGAVLPLHDASLVSVDLDWAQATMRLMFETADGPAVYFARGLRRWSGNHEQPWGPSVSVNSARVDRLTEPLGQRLTVEMQSGDVIIVEAERLVRRTVRAV